MLHCSTCALEQVFNKEPPSGSIAIPQIAIVVIHTTISKCPSNCQHKLFIYFSVHARLVYTDVVQTQLCRGSSLEGDDLIYILHLEPFYYENCGALPWVSSVNTKVQGHTRMLYFSATSDCSSYSSMTYMQFSKMMKKVQGCRI